MDCNNPEGFTYWDAMQGWGGETGKPHYGNHAWPTLSPAILMMVEDKKVDHFLKILHSLDKETKVQGFQAFVWNIGKTI